MLSACCMQSRVARNLCCGFNKCNDFCILSTVFEVCFDLPVDVLIIHCDISLNHLLLPM